jgi:hypothetical protein
MIATLTALTEFDLILLSLLSYAIEGFETAPLGKGLVTCGLERSWPLTADSRLS